MISCRPVDALQDASEAGEPGKYLRRQAHFPAKHLDEALRADAELIDDKSQAARGQNELARMRLNIAFGDPETADVCRQRLSPHPVQARLVTEGAVSRASDKRRSNRLRRWPRAATEETDDTWPEPQTRRGSSF